MKRDFGSGYPGGENAVILSNVAVPIIPIKMVLTINLVMFSFV